ncbi:hypothetical protein PAE9249_03022 [Paenibacillus sp. CECT 9249]|uniref:hypothetical protein n=1 Tax=Paenibacillus sp. CECT 9249 TaxID=2845385 RepID=UPI001E3F51CF|nr:hypothetical protein [Paenibacillus sp. CECT 9249]CAH0120503.1 hypothetical protein PAE9249_03022 [Paenibacillus sp. CECT 9249]
MADIVTIRTRRDQAGVRRISGVCVIGSSAPCQGFLVVGRRFAPARRCLLENGFVIVFQSGGVFVFRRKRRSQRNQGNQGNQ